MSEEAKTSVCPQAENGACENVKIIYVANDKSAKDRKSLFDDKYVVPIYQRAFAWGDDQIEQLVGDIYDCESEKLYSLGTLTVSRRGDEFYVVDGQQRLTALYLLLLHLSLDKSEAKEKLKDKLTYQCREADTASLRNAVDGVAIDADFDLASKVFQLIDNAVNKIADREGKKLAANDVKQRIEDNLTRVFLVRIVLPPKTDLPAYFRIMNNSGKQLEAADIVKAKLMERLFDEEERNNFDAIWRACANMDGYVKTHFVPQTRGKLFGEEEKKKRSFLYLYDDWKTGDLKNDKYELSPEVDKDSDARKHINESFSVFLLHALRLFEKFSNNNHDFENYDFTLDDKKLLEAFERFLAQYDRDVSDKGRAKKADIVRSFCKFLLKLRAIYDDFFVTGDENDADTWKISAYIEVWKKTSFGHEKYDARYNNEDYLCKCKDEMRMLQNCLRVTYTSPRAMDWITFLLGKIMLIFEENANYSEQTEVIADKIKSEAYIPLIDSKWVRGKIREYLKGDLTLGTSTPHIVFQYLDLALWQLHRNNDPNSAIDFQFSSRNSVEHFYPQHPNAEEGLKNWADDKELNSPGNLCIVTVQTNSRFSNRSPSAKVREHKDRVNRGSLKLRIMAKCIKSIEAIDPLCSNDPVRTSEIWAGTFAYDNEAHENEKLLFDALGYKAHERFVLAVLLNDVLCDGGLNEEIQNYCAAFKTILDLIDGKTISADKISQSLNELSTAVNDLEKAAAESIKKLNGQGTNSL